MRHEERVPCGTLSVGVRVCSISNGARGRRQYGTCRPQPQRGQPINSGNSFHYQVVQRQGPTKRGFPGLGLDAGQGGQGWLTYHLSANEDIQLHVPECEGIGALFLPGGTTQNDFEGSGGEADREDY